MGLMINGEWHEHEPERSKEGAFERGDTSFRNWITPDGRPGPTGQDGFRAVAGRYHLYVSLACPWAHRTLIMRALKGLQAIIPVSVTHWLMADHGWTFAPGDGVVADPLYNTRLPVRIVRPRRRDLFRAGDGADSVGSPHPNHRQQ